MAYSDFTLDGLIQRFGITVEESGAFLASYAPAPISALLREELAENVPLARDISTEKARSEFIIAPVLTEVRRQFSKSISVFSGVEFNVDDALGFRGVCDYLLSLSPLQLAVQAPVVAIVEAKNENMKAGMGQCVAEMLAAQQFNTARGKPLPFLYGVVTTGTTWRFLRLEDAHVLIDDSEHSIENVERIVGILVGMVREGGQSAA